MLPHFCEQSSKTSKHLLWASLLKRWTANPAGRYASRFAKGWAGGWWGFAKREQFFRTLTLAKRFFFLIAVAFATAATLAFEPLPCLLVLTLPSRKSAEASEQTERTQSWHDCVTKAEKPKTACESFRFVARGRPDFRVAQEGGVQERGEQIMARGMCAAEGGGGRGMH